MKAIESRDETTEGHSHRVARMTKRLAITATRAETGLYSAFHMSEEQIRELNYAALLHDFGKVGVNEKVLRKGKGVDLIFTMVSTTYRHTIAGM